MRARARSIPACAGEPTTHTVVINTGRVYPRVCGGTSPSAKSVIHTLGLSPRVRGNPAGRRLMAVRAGSIPACAGEPGVGVAAASTLRVYPRVCGGTNATHEMMEPEDGLSPRVRGNLRRDIDKCAYRGSIPACAGEPDSPAPASGACPVYPRVCGGTDIPA